MTSSSTDAYGFDGDWAQQKLTLQLFNMLHMLLDLVDVGLDGLNYGKELVHDLVPVLFWHGEVGRIVPVLF